MSDELPIEIRETILTREQLEKINDFPGLTPASDERFMELLAGAADGTLPVFYAHIPLGALVPFDLDYRPDLHPMGQMMIRETTEQAVKGNFKHPIVYQRGYWFVVSDDYPMLFSAVNGRPDQLACFVLGTIDHPQVENIQRVRAEDVRSILGV